MTSKKLFVLTFCIFCLGLTTVLSTIGTAQQTEVTIENFTSQLVKQRQIAGKVQRTFAFVLILRNTGDAETQNLSANFLDLELNATLPFFTTPTGNITYFTIPPNQNITLYAKDWPTMIQDASVINVSFGPDQNTVHTASNSGYKVYPLAGVTKPKASTPGFEVAFVLLAIVILLSRKIKKK